MALVVISQRYVMINEWPNCVTGYCAFSEIRGRERREAQRRVGDCMIAEDCKSCDCAQKVIAQRFKNNYNRKKNAFK